MKEECMDSRKKKKSDDEEETLEQNQMVQMRSERVSPPLKLSNSSM